jgi:hypothetical protein
MLMSCRQDMDFSRHEYTSNPTEARRLIFERSQQRFNAQTSKVSLFFDLFQLKALGLRVVEPGWCFVDFGCERFCEEFFKTWQSLAPTEEDLAFSGLVEHFGRHQCLSQHLL